MKLKSTLRKTLWQFTRRYPGDGIQFRALVFELLSEIEQKIEEAPPHSITHPHFRHRLTPRRFSAAQDEQGSAIAITVPKIKIMPSTASPGSRFCIDMGLPAAVGAVWD